MKINLCKKEFVILSFCFVCCQITLFNKGFHSKIIIKKSIIRNNNFINSCSRSVELRVSTHTALKKVLRIDK